MSLSGVRRRHLRVAGIGAALVVVLAGCGDDAGRPTEVALSSLTQGVWDAAVSHDMANEPTIADVRGDLRVGVFLTPRLPFGHLTFEGTFGADGSATLAGEFLGSDFLISLTGSATATRLGTMERMTGSLVGFRTLYTFDLTRAANAAPERFGGAYTFLLAASGGQASMLAVDLNVRPDGHGEFAHAVETARETGAVIADLTSGQVRVSPSGRLRLSATYETREPGCPIADPFGLGLEFEFDARCALILIGELGAPVEGVGRFSIDAPVAEIRTAIGSWTATRR